MIRRRASAFAVARLFLAPAALVACTVSPQADPDEQWAASDGSGLATSTWTFCANEHERCSFTGTMRVRYGTSRRNVVATFTNGVDCENANFGDPAPGVLKKCWYDSSSAQPAPAPAPSPAPAPTPAPSQETWTKCADEHQVCTFTGRRRVRYGVGDPWMIGTFDGSVACENDVFGDPAPGLLKRCEVSSLTDAGDAGAPAPSPAPNPTPTPTPAPTGAAGPRVTTFAPSGPITATAGQVISGVKISNPGGPCIQINQPNVVVRDSEIGPCGGEANILVTAGSATVEYSHVFQGNRGVLMTGIASGTVQKTKLETFYGPAPRGSAVEVDYSSGVTVDGNVMRGSAYKSDVLSVFQSSFIRLTNNDIDVQIDEPSAAPFTIGDALQGQAPGHDNYASGNIVHSTGGVPPGVFGSSGNTLFEKNCLTSGIQAYDYNNNAFTGVTIRNNVINVGASFVPNTSVIAGWSTNINGTNCALVPQ